MACKLKKSKFFIYETISIDFILMKKIKQRGLLKKKKNENFELIAIDRLF